MNHRTAPRRLLVLLVMLAAAAALAPTGSTAADTGAQRSATIPTSADRVAGYAANPRNPLAHGSWGVYTGSADGVYPAYEKATGTTRALLAKVALRSRVRWFGSWMSASEAGAKIRDYIATTQDGDPDVLVPMAVFRLWPEGEGAKRKPLTSADLAAYRHWVDTAAAAIGGSRVAMVLEPDLAVALTGWRPRVRQRLTAYAASVFGRLPRTSVYIDASDSDWLTVDRARDMLIRSGIRYVRGFALGATHYSGTAANIRYGRKVVGALARAGVGGRHFVIDTADNGRPFTWLQYWAAHPKGDFDNAETCRTRAERRCDTLGIPPTWQVASSRWGLPARLLPAARRHVDGYLWFGRPWLYRQASPFLLDRTLQVARTTRF
ncbi:MAG TPA: glycoside hydrolase family 6 protein [Marmoricola sp.]